MARHHHPRYDPYESRPMTRQEESDYYGRILLIILGLAVGAFLFAVAADVIVRRSLTAAGLMP